LRIDTGARCSDPKVRGLIGETAAHRAEETQTEKEIVMNKRIRLNLSWTISIVEGFEGAPFSCIDDFYAHARANLCSRFIGYRAELAITVRENFGSIAILDMVWDVDRDMVPGAWNNPEDHIRLARHALVDGISDYGRKITISVSECPVAVASLIPA